MAKLEGQVALVTGGARGLGESICHSLTAVGIIPIVADMREDLAEKVALEIQSEGRKAMALRLDVRDDAQIDQAIQQILNTYGHLDILINNAGTDVTLPIEELEISDWDRVLAVNLRAPFVLSKKILPVMKQQGQGHIVNIASTASKRVWPNASAYHASKWGLLGFSHALHVEARPHRVKVTAIVAGGMQTPFILDRFPDTPPEKLQDPRNVADTIRFVLSQPAETVIPEMMVIPMQESSWP
ncbi:MAG: SDR family oxidoreductase [Leptolyngbyaceae cyanobacterium bins.59]|nr:SDR family oxidoreductase [Leptolyngbyaceae cyanobacterium bins.59]